MENHITNSEILQIVSFSGGKDSTAMLLLMLENNYKIDHIIFFDTGWEFPEIYRHIDKVEQYTGLKITKIHPQHTFDFYFHEYRSKKGKHLDKVGLSWPDFGRRWCTKLKVQAIKRYCRSLGKYITYEGIAFDEFKRQNKNKIYPLVNFKFTEKKALQYCYSKGFDWEGLYTIFDRVSCYRCPLKNLKELKNLYIYKPELWAIMQEADKNTCRKFRPDYTLNQLTAKFEKEVKRSKNIKSLF